MIKQMCSPGWVAQLVGALTPTPKKAVGQTPGQGAYLGGGLDPWSGHILEATDGCFSPILTFLFLSLPFSLKSIKVSLGKGYKRMCQVPSHFTADLRGQQCPQPLCHQALSFQFCYFGLFWFLYAADACFLLLKGKN